MLRGAPSLLLVCGLFLFRGAVAAEAAATGPLAGVRRIELRADLVSPLPEVRIAPGLSTTVFFDGRISPDEVKLEGRERFLRLGLAEDHLALVPSSAFRSGERLRLEVRFRDGGAPERATVMLVVDATQVERQVEFFRRPRTAESYRQEVEELKAGMVRLQREVERLRASGGPAGGLDAVFHSLDGPELVRFTEVSYQRVSSPFLVPSAKWVTLGARVRALRLRMQLPEQEGEWMAVGASLLDTQGRAVNVHSPWQQEPLRLKLSQVLVVRLEGAEMPPQGRYTLKLWDEHGRTVTIEGLEVH